MHKKYAGISKHKILLIVVTDYQQKQMNHFMHSKTSKETKNSALVNYQHFKQGYNPVNTVLYKDSRHICMYFRIDLNYFDNVFRFSREIWPRGLYKSGEIFIRFTNID